MARNTKSMAPQVAATHDDTAFPAISPKGLLAHNALYRRRQTLQTEVRGAPLSLELSARPWSSNATSRRFTVNAGIWNFQLDMPGSFVEHLMGGLCKPASFHGFSPLQQAILIEAALENLLAPLETATKLPMQFVADGNVEVADVELDLHVAFSTFNGIIRLGLNTEAGTLLANVWNDLPADAAFDVNQLMLPLQLLIGAQTLSIAELSALRPGDTIISESDAPEELYALCAGQLQARCTRSDQGITLTSGWNAQTIARHNAEQIPSERGTAMDEGVIDNLSVRVIFELARTDMPLRELKELAEGSIVPVAPISEGAVAILANGKKIGQGDIVRLGEGLGVRILQLGTHD